MSVGVVIVDGPLGPAEATPGLGAGQGAFVVFEGVVRPDEAGRPISGLVYQAYRPMAARQLEELAGAAVRQYRLLGVRVEHSEGFVPVGRASFRLTVWSEHRAEALAAMGWFIDAMKRDVPIWKQPRAAD